MCRKFQNIHKNHNFQVLCIFNNSRNNTLNKVVRVLMVLKCRQITSFFCLNYDADCLKMCTCPDQQKFTSFRRGIFLNVTTNEDDCQKRIWQSYRKSIKREASRKLDNNASYLFFSRPLIRFQRTIFVRTMLISNQYFLYLRIVHVLINYNRKFL